MAYPTNTPTVLEGAGYTSGSDFNFIDDGKAFYLEWFHADPEPTEQQINGWASDTDALPSGQLFSAWEAEHGGDQTLTRRRVAKEKPDDGERVDIRALIELFNKRDNYLTNRIAELQSALDAIKASNGPADNIRAAIPESWLATNTRSRPQAKADYDAIIDAGTADE